MSQPQKGICAEPNLHAQYLLFNVVDEDSQAVRAKLGRVLEVLDHYDNEHYEAMVSGVIAVGNNYWSELFPGPIPVELTPFPDMQCEDRVAPSTPTDLFIQIRADRWDICYAIGLEVMELLRIHVELGEHVQGFRYLDGRDLNGYLYAPDNPRGMQRMNVAVLGADEEFVGGSYVHVQRFRHDLRRWQSLSQRQQEQVMGTTKEHNLASVECNPSSPSVRANLTSHENGVPELLKQGMPYGDMLVQGMFSVTCSSSSQPFKRMLDSQIFGTGDGDYDRWLDFTSAESGGAYFAPSINFIKQQAKL